MEPKASKMVSINMTIKRLQAAGMTAQAKQEIAVRDDPVRALSVRYTELSPMDLSMLKASAHYSCNRLSSFTTDVDLTTPKATAWLDSITEASRNTTFSSIEITSRTGGTGMTELYAIGTARDGKDKYRYFLVDMLNVTPAEFEAYRAERSSVEAAENRDQELVKALRIRKAHRAIGWNNFLNDWRGIMAWMSLPSVIPALILSIITGQWVWMVLIFPLLIISFGVGCGVDSATGKLVKKAASEWDITAKTPPVKLSRPDRKRAKQLLAQ